MSGGKVLPGNSKVVFGVNGEEKTTWREGGTDATKMDTNPSCGLSCVPGSREI